MRGAPGVTMAEPFLAFTPIERVTIETILEERPSFLDTLSKGLTPVLDEVART